MRGICKFKDCSKNTIAKGYCGAHYAKLKKIKDSSVYGDDQRIHKLDFSIDDNGCFICTSHKPNTKGYPMIGEHGKRYTIGRFIYNEMFGEIPEGHVIRHTCDNRMCINPAHLLTGTPKENSEDMVERARVSRGNKHPRAKLTEEKVLEIKDLLKKGELTQKKIADLFSVHRSAILGINLGRTWKHVNSNDLNRNLIEKMRGIEE